MSDIVENDRLRGSAMSTTTTDPIQRACPPWCVHHDRADSRHAEDRYTRHCAEDVVVTMSRGSGGLATLPFAELTLSMDHMAYDVPCEDEWGPVVYFRGDDGSGSLVQLSLKVEDAEKVALALLRLTEMVDGEGAEVTRTSDLVP